jgi:hypothetical protein
MPHVHRRRNKVRESDTSSSCSKNAVMVPQEFDFHSWSEDNLHRVVKTWSLNENQSHLLREFQNLISDIDHWKNEPHTALRFLKEYHWHIKPAEKHFRKMVQWRIDNHADTLLEEYRPPPLFDYFPIAVLKGLDRDGDPIHIERTGVAQPWSLYQLYGYDEMIKQANWAHEIDSRGKWVQLYEDKHKRPMTLMTAIVDLDGLSFKHVSPTLLHLAKDVAHILQANFPSVAKRIIVIRAPDVFRIVWNFLKPFLRESIRETLVFAAASNYLEVLEKYMDLSVLPRCINPEGTGESIDEFSPVWMGGPLPLNEEEQQSSRKFGTTVPENPKSAVAVATPLKPHLRSRVHVTCTPIAVGGYRTTFDGHPVVTQLSYIP